MPHYSVFFHHDIDTGDQYLSSGDAYQWMGAVWRVEKLVPPKGKEAPTVLLKPWPSALRYPAHIKGTSA